MWGCVYRIFNRMRICAKVERASGIESDPPAQISESVLAGRCRSQVFQIEQLATKISLRQALVQSPGSTLGGLLRDVTDKCFKVNSLRNQRRTTCGEP